MKGLQSRSRTFLQILDLVDKTCQDKHASLLQIFINYGNKKFNKIDMRVQCHKSFYSNKLRISQASVFSPCKPFQDSIMFAGKAPK
jgi:hypothetical protein